MNMELDKPRYYEKDLRTTTTNIKVNGLHYKGLILERDYTLHLLTEAANVYEKLTSDIIKEREFILEGKKYKATEIK